MAAVKLSLQLSYLAVRDTCRLTTSSTIKLV